jgi:hypothetical protein
MIAIERFLCSIRDKSQPRIRWSSGFSLRRLAVVVGGRHHIIDQRTLQPAS